MQQRYTEMRVWKLAHRLVLRIYELTRQLPGDERYGLTSQIRRAAVSVELNIVEGSRRGTDAEFARFLDMSLASLAETEAVVLICKDLNYISAEVAASLFNDINSLTGMLMNLKKACRHQSSRSEATQS